MKCLSFCWPWHTAPAGSGCLQGTVKELHAAVYCLVGTAHLQTVQLQSAQLQEPSEVYSVACKMSAEALKPQIVQGQPLACTPTALGPLPARRCRAI